MRRVCFWCLFILACMLLSSCYKSHGFTREQNVPMQKSATESRYYPLR